MSKCLCCAKEIGTNASEWEKTTKWHKRCVRSFFESDNLPEVDINDAGLKEMVTAAVKSGYTIAGVQKKLSLHLSRESKKKTRLTLVNYPSGYILKPATKEYSELPESEFLSMQMAKTLGISTVPFALIEQDGEYAYITKRIDRIKSSVNGDVELLGMEDFCQLDGRLTHDKYKGSYENCARILKKYSDRYLLDATELFMRVLFSYLTGNSDMHLKNFSLIEEKEGSERYVLSKAYDMLPVNIILENDKEELALTLNGKKKNITRNDFFAFASKCGINDKAAVKMMNKMLSKKDLMISMCTDSYLSKDRKDKLIELIAERCARLTKQS